MRRTATFIALALSIASLPVGGGVSSASPIPVPAELWVMDGAGSNQRPLFQTTDYGAAPGGTPSWSPGGTEIAFGGDGVRVIDIAGGEPRSLYSATFVDGVAWSPDGEWIAFTVPYGDPRGLFLVRPDGSDLHHVGPDVQAIHVAWSPDGSRIAFIGLTEPEAVRPLYVVTRQGDQTTALGNDGAYSPISWAPDSSRIAFIDTSGSLALAGMDGSVTAVATGTSSNFAPEWSPDGTKIAMRTDSGLVAVNPDGSGKILLASSGGVPQWHPGAEMLAFTNGSDIYGVKRDGAGLTNLTNTADSDEGLPVWSPDGTRIAYVSQPRSPVPPDEFHERSLTIEAKRGRIFRGGLFADDAQFCASNQKVKLMRRRPWGWTRVRKTHTDERGRYRIEFRHDRGRFRAIAPRRVLHGFEGSRIICRKAVSPTLRIRIVRAG